MTAAMRGSGKSEYRDEIIRAQSFTPVMDPEECWKSLEDKILAGNIAMDMGRVRAAYEYAVKLHEGQKRRDGSPYVTHCVATAEIIAEQGLDEDSIVSALLHDVIEDTPATHDDVKRQFGATVADIVEGVTKLTRVQYTSHEEEQAENLRKMLIAMAKDIRVILIKIADRLHNMRTMDYQSKEKQLIKSAETMEIYAPIAHRLGMQKIKWELEDRSLYYLDREGYKEITEALSTRMDTLRVFMDKVEKQIQKRMNDEGIDATVYGRIKHIYSIYRKMFAQQLDINGIFDLCAFRVIVDSIPDCYNALGMIHDMYKPVPGRFKDYVSTPKPNGYQSVHTTVIGSEGIPFEVQIRTWDMHLTAEYGVAAHWKYKSGEQAEKRVSRPQKAVHGILVEGLDNCLIKFSKCCTPVPGDDIVGFITRGNGVSIHRTDCQNYLRQRLSTGADGRWIEVSWADHTTDLYITTLRILAKERSGLIMDIATALNALNAKVRSLSARDVGNDQSTAAVTVEVRDLAELKVIINRLAAIRGVIEVRRASS